MDSGGATTMLDLLRAGGPVVAILGAMSVLALAIVIAKAWQFWRLGLGPGQGARHPAHRIVSLATDARRRHGAAEATRIALRHAADLLEDMRGLLRPLEVIATLAPLLGLFGTVLGMIEAFRRMEAAGSRVDPSVLSGGIWEALLTTAVGLVVAIPAVAMLNLFERVIDRTAHAMESGIEHALLPGAGAGIMQAAAESNAGFGPVAEPAGAD